ncbi:MAG: SDR family NAD(P)-dependent oxidoreductase [Anaerolineaceae bacterium]|nr:SDR family NAD(P)-dependent oxidoreductase [Anaerolineaceae bacterium]
MADRRFAGQVALVTGGASGIGAGIARRLAAEGASVTIGDINPPAQADGLASALMDVRDETSVRRGVAAVVDNHGRLDILVNCAGIPGPTSVKITDYRAEEFDQVVAVNLRGAFLTTRAAIETMLPRSYGRILHLVSIAGKEGNPGMVGYSASKAGMTGLIKGVGKEYATSGITVNGLAPAVIQTPMIADVTPEMLAYMESRIPMGRLGTIEEVASLACWIVSPEASFNTGCIFDLSGGRATW